MINFDEFDIEETSSGGVVDYIDEFFNQEAPPFVIIIKTCGSYMINELYNVLKKHGVQWLGYHDIDIDSLKHNFLYLHIDKFLQYSDAISFTDDKEKSYYDMCDDKDYVL